MSDRPLLQSLAIQEAMNRQPDGAAISGFLVNSSVFVPGTPGLSPVDAFRVIDRIASAAYAAINPGPASRDAVIEPAQTVEVGPEHVDVHPQNTSRRGGAVPAADPTPSTGQPGAPSAGVSQGSAPASRRRRGGAAPAADPTNSTAPNAEPPAQQQTAAASAAPGQTGSRRRRSGGAADDPTSAPAPSAGSDATSAATATPAPSRRRTQAPAVGDVPPAPPVHDDKITDADLSRAASDAAAKITPAEVMKVMAEFGVKSVGAIPQERRRAFLDALKRAGA